jgi:hypothetical protein
MAKEFLNVGYNTLWSKVLRCVGVSTGKKSRNKPSRRPLESYAVALQSKIVRRPSGDS